MEPQVENLPPVVPYIFNDYTAEFKNYLTIPMIMTLRDLKIDWSQTVSTI